MKKIFSWCETIFLTFDFQANDTEYHIFKKYSRTSGDFPRTSLNLFIFKSFSYEMIVVSSSLTMITCLIINCSTHVKVLFTNALRFKEILQYHFC